MSAVFRINQLLPSAFQIQGSSTVKRQLHKGQFLPKKSFTPIQPRTLFFVPDYVVSLFPRIMSPETAPHLPMAAHSTSIKDPREGYHPCILSYSWLHNVGDETRIQRPQFLQPRKALFGRSHRRHRLKPYSQGII